MGCEKVPNRNKILSWVSDFETIGQMSDKEAPDPKQTVKNIENIERILVAIDRRLFSRHCDQGCSDHQI